STSVPAATQGAGVAIDRTLLFVASSGRGEVVMRSTGRGSRRRSVVALGAFVLALAPVAFAPFGATSASAQSVCYDDSGNIVPAPPVPPPAPPPNTQAPPTLPPSTPPPSTSPPATQAPPPSSVSVQSTPPRTTGNTSVPVTQAPASTTPTTVAPT